MRGIGGRQLAAALALGMLAVCVFLVSRLLQAKGLVWATYVTTVGSFVLAAATPAVLLVRKLLGWLSGAPPLSAVTVEQARAGFADALARQWAEEDRLRQVYDPWPLPVRWHLAGGAAAGSGQFADIGSVFADTQRMVILGDAGAGKSVLASKLVRELLASRAPAGRVPVLLSASTWTRDCTMMEWVTEQLVRSQPNLNIRISGGAGEKIWLPEALADSCVIPVIDGLDELPPDRRAVVIAEVNAFGSDYPLVLTSRPAEYHAAVAARGISRATVIELEPLRASEVRRYLTEATDAPSERWRRVFVQMGAEADGVLARTLATPLMIWLARTVYQAGDSDPGELLSPGLLSERGALEAHLVAALVPAVYAKRRSRSFQCGPEQATRWLGFLADYLNRNQSQEIAWWQLGLAAPVLRISIRALRAALYVCITWQVAVWALTRQGYWRQGRYVGHGRYQDLLLAGPLGRTALSLLNDTPGSNWPAGLRSARQTGAALDWGLREVADLGLFPLVLGVILFVVLVGIAEPDRTSTPTPQTLKMTWHKLWRQLLPAEWLIVLGLIWLDATDPHHSLPAVLRASAGWGAWLALALARRIAASLRTPAEIATGADAAGLLRGDRRACLARAAVVACGLGIVWLWAGSVLATAALVGSALGLCVVLLLGGAGGAWTAYLDARLRLAATGRMPWHMIAFLDDAHRRGVLRQTGAVYQFRHIRLQDLLAAAYEPWPPSAAAARIGRQLARLQPFPPSLITERAVSPPSAEVVTEYSVTLEAGAGRVPQMIVLLVQALFAVAFIVITVLPAQGVGYGLVGAAGLVSIPLAIIQFDNLRAAAHLPRGRSSVHVTPARIEVTHGSHRVSLGLDDVELIAVRTLGNSWWCHALQVKLKSSGKWFPLYWTPRYSTWIPRDLVSAVTRFAGDRVDPVLAGWLNGQTAVGYEESGTVRTGKRSEGVSPALLLWLTGWLALAGVLFVAGWIIPALLVGGCGGAVALTGLERYTAWRKLPRGPWSLHVNKDAIEVTRASRNIRLLRDDVERIETRPLGSRSGARIVYAKLRSDAAVRLHVSDGWFPLYWMENFSEKIPSSLLVSLTVFAPRRLAGPLKDKADKALRVRVPASRRFRRVGRSQMVSTSAQSLLGRRDTRAADLRVLDSPRSAFWAWSMGIIENDYLGAFVGWASRCAACVHGGTVHGPGGSSVGVLAAGWGARVRARLSNRTPPAAAAASRAIAAE